MKLTWFQLHYAEIEEIPVSLRHVNVSRFLASFFRETTLQGFPSIVKQGGIVRKLYWIICVIGSIYALQWELDAFFSKFLRWQAATQVTIQPVRQLDFPAITLCNNNPVTREWFMTLQPRRKDADGDHQQSSVSRKKRDTDITNNDNNHNNQGNKNKMSAPMINMFNIMESACRNPYSNRTQTGHSLCDVVLRCTYNGVTCDVQTAMDTWFWSPLYGNCWTFNAGYKKADSPVYKANPKASAWDIKRGVTADGADAGVRKATQTGAAYGLHLILNADVDHYLYTTPQVGWRIVVHNQTEMPFPEEAGLFVMPGTATHVGVKMSYNKRLGVVANGLYSANYSNCVDSNELQSDAANNAFSNILEVAYTPAACLKTCYQYNVMKQCSCFDFFFPNNGSAFASIPNYQNLPACSYSNDSLWTCKEAVWQKHVNNQLNCYCPDSCLTYSYDTTISQLKWPGSDYMTVATVCKDLQSLLAAVVTGNNCTNSVLASEYKRHGLKLYDDLKSCTQNATFSTWDETAQFTIGSQFAEVFVYFSDFKHQSIVEYEVTEFTDLVAYLGGILGLFFGFSMLTMCEYVMLAFDLIAIGAAKLILRLNNRTSAGATSVDRLKSDVSSDEARNNGGDELQIRGPVCHKKMSLSLTHSSVISPADFC